jgi:predicted nucleotidyltransferase
VFENILSGLVSAGVRFVVVGGVASTAHGSTRVTNDIDICYDTAQDNLIALAGVLASWGAYLRGVPPGLPFTMDDRALRTTPLMTLTTRLGNIDVLDEIKGVGRYPEVLAASEPCVVGQTQFRILSLPALIDAKRAAGRPKDKEHLIELEALLNLKKL